MAVSNLLVLIFMWSGICPAIFADVNLALFRPTDMSSISFHTFPHGSEKAVDGNNDTNVVNGHCTHTREFMSTVWWRVGFATNSTIHRVHIVYRTLYESRLAGYSLYITNNVIRSNSFFQEPYLPIFHDMGPQLPNTVQTLEFSPPITGLYLSIFNNRTVAPLPNGYSQQALLELCEVEAYGCPKGRYRFDCGAFCSTNCQDDICHPVSGNCSLGCKAGYRGEFCYQACLPRTFGQNCNSTCYCRSRQCNTVSGVCSAPGCLAGWTGLNCATACSPGWFGEDCSTRCNCQSGSCDRMSGICSVPGCTAGYQGQSCSVACSADSYGPDCNSRCGQCANGVRCNIQNGTCNGMCADGYIGDKCQQRCEQGFYGANCSMECGACYNARPCHHVSGSCRRQGTPTCKAGLRGEQCKTECSSSTFGVDCASQCGACQSNTCDSRNGTCLGGCSSSEALGPTCLLPLVAQANNTAVTVVLVILSLLLIIALIVVAVIIYKRYTYDGIKDQATKMVSQVRSSFKKARDRTASSIRSNRSARSIASMSKARPDKETVYINVSDRTPIVTVEPDEDQNVYCNSASYDNVTPGDIPVDDMVTVIRQKSESENAGFKEEFKSIPYGQHGNCSVAEKPANLKRNRFKQLYPYDASRVILRDQRSDYINASFIDGIGESKKYIASQGPKPNTVDDFWTMIWQENVPAIIMLTNLRESDKRKCEQYWPYKDDTLESNNLQIVTKTEKVYSDHTLRYFSVTHKNTQEERQIMQYHYTSWPDHGVPETLSLLQFHKVVLNDSNEMKGPLVVHCSAGVGRTGTYIGLDVLHKQGHETGCVNVYNYVTQMRENRMNMIQTLDQYIFLYRVLREGIRHVDACLSKEEFVSEYQKMIDTPQPANMSVIRKQFQDLESCRPAYIESAFMTAKLNINTSRNKSNEPLPVDKYRAVLTSKMEGHTDYINGVILSSFTECNSFILTRYPLPTTTTDLWRLFIDHEIDSVIFYGSTQTEEISSWMPGPGEVREGNQFLISNGDVEKDETGISSSILTVYDKSITQTIKLVEMKPCDMSNVNHEDHQRILSAIEEITEWRNTSGTGPILFISPDGVQGFGVVFAVYNALEQLTEDNEVDVFNIVKRMRVRRPELIQTFEEYQSIYAIIETYLTATNSKVERKKSLGYENVRMSTDGQFVLEADV